MPRQPSIHHCTSLPATFVGRHAELALLNEALDGGNASLVAMVGPGGQGKTAIVQHWLGQAGARMGEVDGVFLWSFYRGKDSDLCLRELHAYAEGLAGPPEVAASFCVDRLLPRLRQERWALVLDGTEVVQHEHGAWLGRFLHPELGRLLEELASAPMPGVAVLTTRFPLPTLETRRHARLVSLSTLDLASACSLLVNLGVTGDVEAAANAAGLHAKAVELMGTYLGYAHHSAAAGHVHLPAVTMEDASAEELHVAQVLDAFQLVLPPETKDILALATAFRQPPTEARLLQYLVSGPAEHLLHVTWGRVYVPFAQRPGDWLAGQVQLLVDLRLLERVGLALGVDEGQRVLDAHPLVRRGFENVLGGQEHSARARAGFLRGRPDRRPPQSLEEAREEVELFHAYCDAELWNEADSTLVALDNPKHRFLAPAFERDLLLRFFPAGDWRQPPLWSGFGRQRSLAICFELLGQFADAIDAYRPTDGALRGDALIALGRLEPFVNQPQVAEPWQALWQAYRAHALCLLGQNDEALRIARTLIPVDVYEWVHVFESLLRLGQLQVLDLGSLLYRPPLTGEHRWSTLARQRMRLDHVRVTDPTQDLDASFRELLEAYDRGGLPFERTLTRLSHARWLLRQERSHEAEKVLHTALDLAQRHDMKILAIDAEEMLTGRKSLQRDEVGYQATTRP